MEFSASESSETLMVPYELWFWLTVVRNSSKTVSFNHSNLKPDLQRFYLKSKVYNVLFDEQFKHTVCLYFPMSISTNEVE